MITVVIPEWQEHAACNPFTAYLFYKPERTNGPESRSRIAAAKSLCITCPVRLECLDYSLREREEYGVWGGLTQAERRFILGPVDGEPLKEGEGLSLVRQCKDPEISKWAHKGQ